MAKATATAVPRSFSSSGVIRGYHMYQKIWTPHVGEKATMVRESGNEHDQFTVALLEDKMLYTVSGESLVFFLFFLFLVVQDLSLLASLVVQR